MLENTRNNLDGNNDQFGRLNDVIKVNGLLIGWMNGDPYPNNLLANCLGCPRLVIPKSAGWMFDKAR